MTPARWALADREDRLEPAGCPDPPVLRERMVSAESPVQSVILVTAVSTACPEFPAPKDIGERKESKEALEALVNKETGDRPESPDLKELLEKPDPVVFKASRDPLEFQDRQVPVEFPDSRE